MWISNKLKMVLTLLFLCVVLFSEGSSSQRTLNNSSVSLILSDQCVTREEVQSLLQAFLINLPNGSFYNPINSCRDIRGAPSNYYWIQNTITGSPAQVYCDMTRRCCGSTSGWMQVANLDMTDPSQHCPSGFRLITSPRRMCGKHSSGCVSATFPVHGVEYSRVCGRVIGYQYASTDGFGHYYLNRALSIDSNYVDGVSVTHGRSL